MTEKQGNFIIACLFIVAMNTSQGPLSLLYWFSAILFFLLGVFPL